jgi:hypothetical protein
VAPASPNVTSRFAETALNRVTKVDLLFMIDNSGSMADKQDVLAQVIPDLVDRLLHPICVDADGSPAGNPDAAGRCAPPSKRDFEPVSDLHVGIITSSLGGHGANVCHDADDKRSDRHNEDMGHLVARTSTDPAATGFLTWDGTGDANALKGNFADMVHGVGQHGCGYEASLEAVYRFLVDPEPYQTVVHDPNPAPYGWSVPTGIDDVLLGQRAAFLRPDSLVAVIMVTDENDCSIQDEGQGFLAITPAKAGTPTSLARGTSACAADPLSPCCFNCEDSAEHPDCPPAASDPSCQENHGHYSDSEDPTNLRCFHQKQRHGIDLLYPVERYIDGLSRPAVRKRNGEVVKNPLFDDLSCNDKDCAPPRDPDLVVVAGIIGVPWQDIAVDPHDLSKGYKTAKKIRQDNVWPVILGDPAHNLPPLDPLMIESIEPRTSAAPNPMGTKESAQSPDSAFGANSVNGHEWNTAGTKPANDLQYACVFDLQEQQRHDCATSSADCDCLGTADSLAAAKNPLCQDPATGAYGNVQFRAKGYPGTRQLQVLQGLGDQGIVASICPAETSPAKMDRLDWGYRPAIAALIARLRIALNNRCLPRRLEVNQEQGSPDFQKVPCVVVEAFEPKDGVCDCTDPKGPPGRVPVSPEVVTEEIRAHGCACELVQLTGDDRDKCQHEDPYSGEGSGWCYVDPEQGGTCALVSGCPATDRRILRFVGPNHDSDPRGTTFITCQEKAFSTAGGAGPASVCGG